MEQQKLRRGFFYSWSSHDLDEHYYTQLADLLRPLIDEAHLEECSARQILAGDNILEVTKKKLESAAYILLLLSSNYLESESCNREMQGALKLQESGEACIIPILLRPCSLPKVLEESLCCLPDNGQPMSLWEKDEAALSDVAQDIRLILGRPSVSFLGSSTDTDRKRLLRKVSTWIPRMLRPSFERGSRLHLLLEERSDVLADPDARGNRKRVKVQEFKSVRRPLFAGIPIIRVYDDADGKLLILGEPGAGKTTLLLELTYKLLVRAHNNEKALIPVVFPLASWAKKQAPLDKWLMEELATTYKMRHEVCRRWVEEGQVIPLLDGLDEVGQEARAACIRAIADYHKMKQFGVPLVICCRLKEYQAFPASARLPLARAVNILSLTKLQINEYLSCAESQDELEGLRQALSIDKDLFGLANRPLMLNIFTLAYQGATAAEVLAGETPEERQRRLFAQYVERMLTRRKELKRWKQQRVIRALSFLAKQMQQDNQTSFSVEHLQPTWLSGKWRLLYRWCVGLLFWLLVGLPIGLLAGLFFGGFVGLVSGMLVGLFSMFAGVRSGFFSEIDIGLYQGFEEENRIKIAFARSHTWSWKQALTRLRKGGALGGNYSWLYTSLFVGLLIGLLRGPIFGLLGGLAAIVPNGLALGLSNERLSEDPSPNKGIWRIGKHGLFFGTGMGLSMGLVMGLVMGVGNIGLIVGLGCGLLSGLWVGLDAFVEHFILRFFFWVQGDFPWDLIPFWDETVERSLLRQVGGSGSYTFIHLLLRDYLASQHQTPK